MTKKVPYRTILLILFSFIFTSIYAQKNSSRSWNDTNEYAMSVNYVYKYEIKGEEKPDIKDGKQEMKDV